MCMDLYIEREGRQCRRKSRVFQRHLQEKEEKKGARAMIAPAGRLLPEGGRKRGRKFAVALGCCCCCCAATPAAPPPTHTPARCARGGGVGGWHARAHARATEPVGMCGAGLGGGEGGSREEENEKGGSRARSACFFVGGVEWGGGGGGKQSERRGRQRAHWAAPGEPLGGLRGRERGIERESCLLSCPRPILCWPPYLRGNLKKRNWGGGGGEGNRCVCVYVVGRRGNGNDGREFFFLRSGGLRVLFCACVDGFFCGVPAVRCVGVRAYAKARVVCLRFGFFWYLRCFFCCCRLRCVM